MYIVTVDWEGVRTIQGNECEHLSDAIAYAAHRLAGFMKIHEAYPKSEGKPRVQIWKLSDTIQGGKP